MKQHMFSTLLFVAMALLLSFFVILPEKRKADELRLTIGRLSDSVTLLRSRFDSLKARTPGLGEYMSTIQLHITKLWFAAHASNWRLARYEHDELGEAMEAAEALHARRDSVDITSVLASIRQTQLRLLDSAITGKEVRRFGKAYDETLSACNGCHRSAGYPFIRIIIPTREPVTNQRWDPAAQ